MGMFSWKCKGCGHELIEGELVRLDANVQTYDGYGGSDEDGEPSAWHGRCYVRATIPEKLDETPSAYAPNQGFGPAKLEFLPDYDEYAKNTYTVFVATGWYGYENDGDSKEFEFHLTNNGILEDQKEYKIRYDKVGEEISFTPEEWDEFGKLPEAEKHNKYLDHQKRIEELVGSAMPSRNTKEFASIDEAIAAVEPLLLDLPEKCKGLYDLQIHGKQGKVEGVVYQRIVNERWDRSGHHKDWIKLEGFEVEEYRIGNESASNAVDRLKLAINHFKEVEKALEEASDAMDLALESYLSQDTCDATELEGLIDLLPSLNRRSVELDLTDGTIRLVDVDGNASKKIEPDDEDYDGYKSNFM